MREFPYDVFLSYNSAQKLWVRDLARRLRDSGFKVWLDEWRLRGGESWIGGLERGVRESQRFVFVVSPESIEAEWPEFEQLIAILQDPAGRSQRVIPVIHTHYPLPPRLEIRQCIDFSDSHDDPLLYDFKLAQLMADLDPSRERPTDFELWRKQSGLEEPPAASEAQPPKPNLIPNYTLDTFIVGSSNRLAHAAALAVAEMPGESYNPLFIHGGVGLGKTHLLHAIGNLALSPKCAVLYVSSETFTNDRINAIRTQTTEEFRAKYRQLDVLLVDDIQFIAGKESTQEEFFHTFDALHSAKKQIVISSDRPPKAIPTLVERLVSRFEWGLITDIQPPNFEHRLAILRFKAEGHPLPIPDDVIDFIAHKFQNNIRQLEGALKRVIAYSQMKFSPLSVELAAEALQDVPFARESLTVTQIIEAVAEFYGLDEEDLRSPRRTKDLALARQVAMYLCREETQDTLHQIGAALGDRDHTTIMHGHDRITLRIEEDEQLRHDVLAIKGMLYEAQAF